MTRPRKRQSPAATGLRNITNVYNVKKYTHGSLPLQLPPNWRDGLPDPASYYRQHVERLGKPNLSGWAQGRCPFHDDHKVSLSLHLADARGGWRCFASCGAGDLVSFHMRLTGKIFANAVRVLIGSRP